MPIDRWWKLFLVLVSYNTCGFRYGSVAFSHGSFTWFTLAARASRPSTPGDRGQDPQISSGGTLISMSPNQLSQPSDSFGKCGPILMILLRLIFTARRYAKAWSLLGPVPVRQSVSRSRILSRRLKISSNFFVGLVAPSLWLPAPIPNSKGNPFEPGAQILFPHLSKVFSRDAWLAELFKRP